MRNIILTIHFAVFLSLAICGGAYLITEVIEKPAIAMPFLALCATIVLSQMAFISFLRWLRENDYI